MTVYFHGLLVIVSSVYEPVMKGNVCQPSKSVSEPKRKYKLSVKVSRQHALLVPSAALP